LASTFSICSLKEIATKSEHSHNSSTTKSFFFLFFLSKLFIASTFYLKKLAAEDENMTTMQFLAESRKQ
jgi:hypothetical protein